MGVKKADKMELIDLTEVLKGFEGEWVILSNDNKKALFSAKTIEELEGHLAEGTAVLVVESEGSYSPTILT